MEYQIGTKTHQSFLTHTTSRPYTPGEKFRIKVDPDRPDTIYVPGTLWFAPIFLLGLGLVVTGISLRKKIFKPENPVAKTGRKLSENQTS